MRALPREAFMPAALASQAYEDTPLPIESGQTIAQACIVALMIEAAAWLRGTPADRRRRHRGAG